MPDERETGGAGVFVDFVVVVVVVDQGRTRAGWRESRLSASLSESEARDRLFPRLRSASGRYGPGRPGSSATGFALEPRYALCLTASALLGLGVPLSIHHVLCLLLVLDVLDDRLRLLLRRL